MASGHDDFKEFIEMISSISQREADAFQREVSEWERDRYIRAV